MKIGTDSSQIKESSGDSTRITGAGGDKANHNETNTVFSKLDPEYLCA